MSIFLIFLDFRAFQSNFQIVSMFCDSDSDLHSKSLNEAYEPYSKNHMYYLITSIVYHVKRIKLYLKMRYLYLEISPKIPKLVIDVKIQKSFYRIKIHTLNDRKNIIQSHAPSRRCVSKKPMISQRDICRARRPGTHELTF